MEFVLARKIFMRRGSKLKGLRKLQRINWMGRPRSLPVLLAATLGVCLLAAGCTRKQDGNLPFYEFDNANGVLVVDGTRYLENREMVGALGNKDRWVFAGKTGDAIGVCGGEEEKGGHFTVYEVIGDEKRDLIIARPNSFSFGPYREFLGFREGIELEVPTSETVSSIAVTGYNEKSKLVQLGEISDAELIEALLELYRSQALEESCPDGTYEARNLHLYHKEYPAIYFYISSSYHVESGTAYLGCADGTDRRLPTGLEELVAVPMQEAK